MNSVFVLAPGEDWIIDRFVREWTCDNGDITVADPRVADVIWLMADFCWTHIPIGILARKKVITSIHHVVPEKFGPEQRREFVARDRITTAYHVPNKHTEAFIRPLTQKPIHVINYWANQTIWRQTGEKHVLREKYGIPLNSFVFGSFQRDTEGHDLSSPKLEKGPDLFADLVIRCHAEGTKTKESGYVTVGSTGVVPRNYHVVLAGWRRQYVISRFIAAGVPYTYIERPSQETINELYQTLDLYPVTSRYEGGPQSLIECGLLNVPCVSRDIGIASMVLPQSAITLDDTWMCEPHVPNVEHLKLPAGYEPYKRLIESL